MYNQIITKLMKRLTRIPFLIKLRHWEYWSSGIIYFPLYPYWLWLSIKARSIYFLTAANPSIKNGGYIMESKKDVYDLLPADFYPETLLFEPGTSLEKILMTIEDSAISFPLIAKPDIGGRGLGVKKIENEMKLSDYVLHMPVAFLIQQFVPFENEVGIFYYRIPGANKGYISGIVNKEPVTVIGDGVSTLTMLIMSNDRYILQWKQIKAEYSDILDFVLEMNEIMTLVPYGNHCRGSKFTDETFRANEELSATIDRICSQIPEFYYGRLDIRFNTWELLEQGKDFSIIELNGSGSEPTHIYDPAHSIFFAWQEIIRHWKILYVICKANNKKGTSYTSFTYGNRERESYRTITSLLGARAW